MFQPGFLESGRATVTFNGSATSLPGAGGTPVTFTALPIGPAANRSGVVIATMMNAVGDAGSVTVGGLPAVKVASAANANVFVDFWVSPDPGGTTANVVLGAGSGASPRIAVSSYSLYGVSSLTPAVTGSDNTSPYNVALAAGSVAIGAFLNPAGSNTAIWTGLVEDVDAGIGASGTTYTTASLQNISGGVTLTVTPTAVNPSALLAAAWA